MSYMSNPLRQACLYLAVLESTFVCLWRFKSQNWFFLLQPLVLEKKKKKKKRKAEAPKIKILLPSNFMSLSLPEPKPELEAKGSEKCSFPHCSL
jgi:hypothetical protein